MNRFSAVVRSAVPAYAFPAATAYLNAQIIPDPDLAARIELASYTSVAIPSAAAATLVTLWLHGRPATAPTLRIVTVAALICAAVAGAVSAVLQDLSILPFTLPSAALGGGLSARACVRRTRTSS